MGTSVWDAPDSKTSAGRNTDSIHAEVRVVVHEADAEADEEQRDGVRQARASHRAARDGAGDEGDEEEVEHVVARVRGLVRGRRLPGQETAVVPRERRERRRHLALPPNVDATTRAECCDFYALLVVESFRRCRRARCNKWAAPRAFDAAEGALDAVARAPRARGRLSRAREEATRDATGRRTRAGASAARRMSSRATRLRGDVVRVTLGRAFSEIIASAAPSACR
eukprot:30979-Pelagococcus_subviridis.AAC.3